MADEIHKIAAALVVYNPGHDLPANINSYYPFVDKLYVYDNSEAPVTFINWSLYEKIEYHHDGENRGLPERLNAAAHKAIAEGFGWLLTMDQDSYFSIDAITNYIRCFQHFEDKQAAALFGPVFLQQPVGQPACQWQQTDHIITSGALTNLEAFRKIGNFDEALFIDLVDSDYCIRAQLSGLKLILFLNVFMHHRMGETVRRSSIKTLFLIKKNKPLHSPLRCYYMLRNYFYIRDKYKNQSVKRIPAIRQVVKDKIINYLLYGRGSLMLLQHLVTAYRHYKQNKMGKLQ